MKRRLVIRPSAEREIDDQTQYLADEASVAVARRFLAAINTTLSLLQDEPGLGARWSSEHPRLHDVRRKIVKGFRNYLIFYRADQTQVEVLHLYHAAQNIDELLEASEG